MTFETLANTIRGRFDSEIALNKNLPTQYDNQDKDKPADNIMWCRFTIKEGQTIRKSIGSPGNNRFRTPGIAIAQIFAPLSQGDKDALQMADNINQAFRAVCISGVHFRVPYIKRVGRVDSNYQVNVICEFYADDIG